MQIMNNLNISGSVMSELKLLELLLEQELSKGSPIITKEALRVLRSGGKRLRPVLTILFSMLGEKYNSDRTLTAAAVIETMHMATLVHDDTIDNAEQRRGIDTTFKKHGVHTAVYTGDWMLLKSLQFLSREDDSQPVNTELLNMLAEGLESVCNGEIDQYFGRGKIPTSKKYYSRIRGKTAALFAASCAAGAKVAGLSDDLAKVAFKFGESFGIAFQIRDDLIDILGTGPSAGKPVENDLNEGIVTLPLILACNESDDFRNKMNTFLKDPSAYSTSFLLKEAIELGGVRLALEHCNFYLKNCEKLLKKFPNYPAREDINTLLESVFQDIIINR